MTERLSVHGPEEDPGATVVVVGAGVSGCACAGRLAAQGFHVIVISSALDVVGLPGYGPDVWAGAGGWREIASTLSLLPKGLRAAWLDSAAVPESGEAVMVVDRRAVSIQSKKALEDMPGVEFRQGLVVDVRPEDLGEQAKRDTVGLEVETAFAEVFRADAVVLAVGLALRGRVAVGSTVIPGGRYGEVPADGLCTVLEGLGASFEETAVDVGPRFSRQSPAIRSALEPLARGATGGKNDTALSRGLVRLRSVLGESESSAMHALEGLATVSRAFFEASIVGQGVEEGAAPGIGATDGDAWPSDFPPAPQWSESLRPKGMVLPSSTPGRASNGIANHLSSGLLPDGAAMGEYYALGAASGDLLEDESGATRLGHRVMASVVCPVDPKGRVLVGGPVALREGLRVAGRAAGAEGYLESLRSGVEVADSVVESLRDRGLCR